MANEPIPLTNARRHFGVVVDAIRGGRHVELSEHGYPIAVIIPIADYRKKFTTPEPNTTEDTE